MTLKIETIVNGPFMENCYLVWDNRSMKGAFIDPGDEPIKLLAAAKTRGVEVESIFNTHGHIDHAGAVAPIKKELNIPFAMHPGDKPVLEGMASQAAMFGLPPLTAPSVDTELADGGFIDVGGYQGKVLHTPGHTPGGVCFLFDDVVFVGDTLFAGSIGRTDFPGGSFEQLIESIKTRLLVLDGNIKALSGHGPSTTIAMEKANNPFLNGAG